ncbi:3'-5' exonuclease [Glycomyces buryatensis]|uniref:3'-5' exonuclease n=1 Tax=Glycomyces buryatensis TaxID=2570927 RepID=A0A4S8QDK4_9ACTN|nr:3'-5' exonuclease [Glycomyces buryatensis]THV41172.1 3'-5' exonuclease [Glycomyces buryatensis]
MYAVIDLETTGLYNKDRVIEVAIAQLDAAGRVTATWETLVNPERDLGLQDRHGIRAAEVLSAPTFDRNAGDIASMMLGRVPVVHNIAFDSRMLASEFQRLDLQIPDLAAYGVCTMSWAGHFLPGAGRGLEACCAAYGIENDHPHHALSDVMATAELFERYLRDAGPVPPWAALSAFAQVATWPALETGRAESVHRGNGETSKSFLSRMVDRLPVVPDPPQADMYLAQLDRALVDRHISATEGEELLRIAADMGIDRTTATELHRGYLAALAVAALEDGVVNEAECADLEQVAALLELGAEAVDAALRAAAAGTGPTPQRAPSHSEGATSWSSQARSPRPRTTGASASSRPDSRSP